MPALPRCVVFAAALMLVAPRAFAQPTADTGKLTIEDIDMKPTRDGFYDATVGFVMSDPKLGKTGAVSFAIVIPHVHDTDEAIDKVHDKIKTFGDDVQRGYTDIHRAP